MTYQDIYQQRSWQNPTRWSGTSHTMPGINVGLGQAANGPYGTPQFGGTWGLPGLWQQRQLSPLDVSEVVRQLLPILRQIVGAIQQGQSPTHMAAIYGKPCLVPGIPEWLRWSPFPQRGSTRQPIRRLQH